MFGSIGVNGVVKNLGLYNVQGTSTNATIDFGIATDVYGTIENVSFYQDTTANVASVFGRIQAGAVLTNVVIHAKNAGTSGFTNGLYTNKANLTNVYVVANKFNSATTGIQYTTTSFIDVDFTTIFDCSATGMWEMNTTLGLPLIKRS